MNNFYADVNLITGRLPKIGGDGWEGIGVRARKDIAEDSVEPLNKCSEAMS